MAVLEIERMLTLASILLKPSTNEQHQEAKTLHPNHLLLRCRTSSGLAVSTSISRNGVTMLFKATPLHFQPHQVQSREAVKSAESSPQQANGGQT
eukprot:1985559-Amphidinium_carterae.1